METGTENRDSFQFDSSNEKLIDILYMYIGVLFKHSQSLSYSEKSVREIRIYGGKICRANLPTNFIRRWPVAKTREKSPSSSPRRNVNQYSCFRHRQDLSPTGSRMEIYETISHVSTNQVWLHINFASSRVYFNLLLPSSLLLG